MSKNDQVCAALIHEKLCITSDCGAGTGLKKVDYIVCIDDDATSALCASALAWRHKKVHKIFPTMLCVGGKGLMSRWTHKTTEGRHLAEVCKRCGIPKGRIVVLDKGTNTGANIQEIWNAVLKLGEGNRVLFACTKRLSLRLKLTQQKQAPKMDACYYVLPESMDAACKWYNGKRLGGCEMMYHELASILDRCEAYAGTFQEPIPFEITPDVRAAADYLASRYRLKMPRNLIQNLRAIPQFLKLYFAIIRNRQLMEDELETDIQRTLTHIETVIKP